MHINYYWIIDCYCGAGNWLWKFTSWNIICVMVKPVLLPSSALPHVHLIYCTQRKYWSSRLIRLCFGSSCQCAVQTCSLPEAWQPSVGGDWIYRSLSLKQISLCVCVCACVIIHILMQAVSIYSLVWTENRKWHKCLSQRPLLLSLHWHIS